MEASGDRGDDLGSRIEGWRAVKGMLVWWRSRTYIPALRLQYSGEESEEEDGGAYPAIGFVWRSFVEVGLV